jgi:hypothetical protein
MRLETFSYLPELSSEQLARQVRSILGRHLVVGIEYTSAPDPYDHYWTMWKLPLFDTDDPAVVLDELEACRAGEPWRVHQGQWLRSGPPGPGCLVCGDTAGPGDLMPRPIMLSIAGDSGSGKTTITRGVVRVLGDNKVTHFSADDYHRYDRRQRAERGVTPLDPECNYLDVLTCDISTCGITRPYSNRFTSTPTAPSGRLST